MQRQQAIDELSLIQSDIDDHGLAHGHQSVDGIDNELCRLLVQQRSWGLLSAVKLQELAAAAARRDEQALLSRVASSVPSSSSSSAWATSITTSGSKSLEIFAALGKR